ncbi:fasciclin domain-containing protein [Seiridium cupressi]
MVSLCITTICLNRADNQFLFLRLVPFILLLSPIFIVASAAEDLPDLGTVLAGQSELSTYYELIKKYPEILLQLPTTGGITILAPSNAAFANIPGTSLSNVWNTDSAEIAVPILLYHVLSSQIPAETLKSGDSIYATTLLTDPAWTSLESGQGLLINRQPGNIVVFISGGGARSILKKVDIPFKGGLVQMIDNLLVPPGAINTTLTSFQDLSFLGALYAADLYDQVANGTGNYTIFASSVPGFQVVNSTLSNLTDGVLQQVMKYHIVPSHVLPSSALLNGTDYPTLLGPAPQSPEIHIHRSGNNLYVNSAQIIQSDILMENGILHIIDNVLNPNVSDPTPNPELGLQPAVYSGAVDASTMVVTDLPWTTALPCTHEVSNDQQLGDKQQHGRRGYCGKVYRLGDEWGAWDIRDGMRCYF